MKKRLYKYQVHLINQENVEVIAEKVRPDMTEDGIRTTVFIKDSTKVAVFLTDKVCGWTKEKEQSE